MVVAVLGAWLTLAVFVLAAWDRISTRKAWRVAALLLTLGFSLLHQLLFSTLADDAFITFRYALNLADGNGPVFNPGDRVEGYSSFLWMVVIALPRATFGGDVEAAARTLGVLAALGCVLLAYFTANRIAARALADGVTPRRAIGVAAAVLTAGASGLAVYGPSGTESPLFVLFVLGICYALAARRPVVAGVLVAATVMTGPEGMVVAVLVVGALVIAAARGRRSWWGPAGYVLGALVFLVPWTAWRVTYYHHLLPNSVVARFGGAQLAAGWSYLTSFSLSHQGFLLIALIAVVALAVRRAGSSPAETEARSLLWLMFAIALGLTATVLAEGGDAAPSWRLLATVPPVLAVASVAAYGVLSSSAAKKPSPRPRFWPVETRLVPAVASGLAGIAVLVSILSPDLLSRVRDLRTQGAQLGEVGAWLGEYLPPGSVVSASATGALAYRAGPQLQVVDVLGRTDEHLARDPGDDDEYVVNARRPTVAVTTVTGYDERQSCVVDPRYAGKYRAATFRRAGTPYWITVYTRAEQTRTLTKDLDEDPQFTYVACPV